MNWKIIRIIDTCIGIPLLKVLSLMRCTKKRENRPPERVKRILLIKFWGIGNIFMMLPAIEALRIAYPAAGIDFLTLDSNRDALNAIGTADSIITISTRSGCAFLLSWMQAVSCLKKKSYDIVIDFEQFARFSVLIAAQTGARTIIGFDTRDQHRIALLTRAIPYDDTIHITRSFQLLAAATGADAAATTLGTMNRCRDEALCRGRDLLSRLHAGKSGMCVVMHIGTSENFPERRWPAEYYAMLADLLVEKFNARIYFTGLPQESFLAEEAMEHLRQRDAAIDLSGRLDFADFLALIAVADLVISADTAAVHLASAVDTRVVGLYGPNTPVLYGPWGTGGNALYAQFDCSPCITNFNAKLHTCRHPAGKGACMLAIQPEDVFAAIRDGFPSPESSWTGSAKR